MVDSFIEVADFGGAAKKIKTDLVATIHTVQQEDPNTALTATRLATLLTSTDSLETLLTAITALASSIDAHDATIEARLTSILAKILASPATAANQATIIAALATQLAAATPAGEAHIGQVGGKTLVMRPAIVVEASPDYSSGDDIFGKVPVTVGRVSGGGGHLTRLQLRSIIAIGVTTWLHIFDSDPSLSTFTKNDLMVLHSSDRSKLLKSFEILAGDWVPPKGISPWYTVELIAADAAVASLAYDLPSGTDMYIAARAGGAINFVATGDMGMIIAAEQN